ncbi:hypothetical protein HaLaN_17626, partial [Haematococcus lacustris]
RQEPVPQLSAEEELLTLYLASAKIRRFTFCCYAFEHTITMLFAAGQRFGLVARNVSQGLRCLSCASAISDGRSMAGEGHLEAAFDELELAPTGNMGSVLNTDGGLPGRGLFDERWRNQASNGA